MDVTQQNGASSAKRNNNKQVSREEFDEFTAGEGRADERTPRISSSDAEQQQDQTLNASCYCL
ncbi:hypothetical protein EYF80_022305 [Liparis tanakae]|uniref:Uncharacterized protein n=1 Tax=Liparis tanakae TaxID=230148 RepID=A0A4Z2HNU1_9TELE|nr:hypothetical protein EYF80_022305 [Liparis tanakae]